MKIETYPYVFKNKNDFLKRANKLVNNLINCQDKEELQYLLNTDRRKEEFRWLYKYYLSLSQVRKIKEILNTKTRTRTINYNKYDNHKRISQLMNKVKMTNEEARTWIVESFGVEVNSFQELSLYSTLIFHVYVESLADGTMKREWRFKKNSFK